MLVDWVGSNQLALVLTSSVRPSGDQSCLSDWSLENGISCRNRLPSARDTKRPLAGSPVGPKSEPSLPTTLSNRPSCERCSATSRITRHAGQRRGVQIDVSTPGTCALVLQRE